MHEQNNAVFKWKGEHFGISQTCSSYIAIKYFHNLLLFIHMQVLNKLDVINMICTKYCLFISEVDILPQKQFFPMLPCFDQNQKNKQTTTNRNAYILIWSSNFPIIITSTMLLPMKPQRHNSRRTEEWMKKVSW